MAIEFKINQLERTVADGGVYTVHWRATKVESNQTVSAYGSIGLTPDPQSPTFVPYENLTESVVIEWVKEAMGAEQLAKMEENFDREIAEKLAPSTAKGLPWQ